MQQKKTKDSREWTTPAQKAYLVSKQSDYLVARGTRNLLGWFSVELEKYFERFPTEPVTATEIIQHADWDIAVKRKFQETVSHFKINRNHKRRLPLLSVGRE
jgi:hypothetical protein